jgi:hypothetical protein
MLTGACLCVSGVPQFVVEHPPNDANKLTNFVRRTATVALNLPDRDFLDPRQCTDELQLP